MFPIKHTVFFSAVTVLQKYRMFDSKHKVLCMCMFLTEKL